MLVKQHGQIGARKLQDYQRGNTIAEYAVIGILGVLVVITGLQVTSGRLNDIFELFKQGITAQSAKADTIVAAQVNAKQSYTVEPEMVLQIYPPAPPAPPVASSPTPAPTASGPVDSSQYSASLGGRVQTLGANGTTFELANQLKILAQKLVSENQITPAESDKIIALANQGFRLADLEKKVEDMSKSQGSNQSFLDSSINFDGQSLTMPQVAGLIGFGTPTDLTTDIKNNNNYMLETANASPETLAFINLYKDAVSSPSLQSNTEVQGIVTQLSSQVSYLTDAVSNLIYGAYATNVNLNDLNNNTASAATLYDSTSICHLSSGCSK